MGVIPAAKMEIPVNRSTTTTLNQNYGRNWLRPQAVLEPRYWRVGLQLDF